MAVAIEHVAGGAYGTAGASPSSTVVGAGITTDGPNRLIVIMCVTARENNSADINQVTAISASGLTFTRIFHDVSFTYNDPGGNFSFPVASFSIDVFTAPAASAQSALAWSSTMSGDGFVNHGTAFAFAVSGLHDITAPFDPDVTVPVTQKNVTGTSSALQVAGLTTANANDMIMALLVNHNPVTDATPVAGTGWTGVTTVLDPPTGAPGIGGGSSHNSMLQSKNFTTTQSGLTVPTNYSDAFWYGLALAFTADGVAPRAPTRSQATVVC